MTFQTAYVSLRTYQTITRPLISFTALSLALFAPGSVLADDSPVTTVDLLTVEHDVRSRTVRVEYDPLYASPKNYEGYDFVDLLEALGMTLETGPEAMDVRLIASDNYVVVLSPEQLLEYRPVLAFEDLNAEYGKPWAPVVYKGKSVDPGPFYLVWPDVETYTDVPWPYQIVKVDLVQNSIYSGIRPDSAAPVPVKTGFDVFTRHCVSCHSVNLTGGTIGPELNTPVSVLDLLQEDVLVPFIRNASDFRARSQMPSFTHLSDAEIDAVISYLGYMKAN